MSFSLVSACDRCGVRDESPPLELADPISLLLTLALLKECGAHGNKSYCNACAGLDASDTERQGIARAQRRKPVPE